jgi:hypothetical protein
MRDTKHSSGFRQRQRIVAGVMGEPAHEEKPQINVIGESAARMSASTGVDNC